jgi:hypothetical protein
MLIETQRERRRRRQDRNREQQTKRQKEKLARALDELLEKMHVHANNALNAEARVKKHESSYTEFRRDCEDFENYSFSYAVVAGLCIVLVVSVATTDLLVFPSTAERLASLGLGYGELVLIAKFLVPVLVVSVETAVSSFFYLAREEAKEYLASEEDKGERKRAMLTVFSWGLAAFGIAAVIPLLALAGLLVVGKEDYDASPEAVTLQRWGLTILVFCFHIAIIAVGGWVHDSFLFLSFKLSDWKKRRQIAQEKSVRDTEQENTHQSFRHYVVGTDRYNTEFTPEPPRQLGPIEPHVEVLINRIQDELRLIAEPGAQQQNELPVQNEPRALLAAQVAEPQEQPPHAPVGDDGNEYERAREQARRQAEQAEQAERRRAEQEVTP